MAVATMTYYSDVLCVWAYVAQIRVDELRAHFGDRIGVAPRMIPVFGDTATKLAEGWKQRGGWEGYADHVAGVAARFEHVTLHRDVWRTVRPTTSLVPHAVIRAVDLVERGVHDKDRSAAEELAWRLRLAFFRDARDVSRVDVALDVASEMKLPVDTLRARLEDGSAWAALHADHDAVKEDGVRGSPTFVLNERRQILYGNVGYRILEANLVELLRDGGDQASWC